MGQATSTRRISAGEVAPRPASPASVTAIAPSTPPPPSSSASSSACYTVPFEATLMNANGTTPGPKRISFAQHVLEEAHWGDYLSSAMRDSVPNNPDRDYVPIEEYDVNISSSRLQEIKGVGPCIVFTGVLTWMSASCPLAEVQRNINWFIGDRMSTYEIDYETWCMSIEPGTVTVA